jgi:cell division protein FtsB
MRVLLFVSMLFFIVSCSSQKKSINKVPKLKHEKKGTKRQIKKYTKEFVNRLYDTTNSIQK